MKGFLLALALGTVVLEARASDPLDSWQRLFNWMILGKLQYGNGTFLGLGQTGTTSMRSVFTSADGQNWNQHSVDGRIGLDLAFGNGVFVLIASEQGIDVVLTSTNGVDWTPSYPVSNAGYRAFRFLHFTNGRFFLQRGFPEPNDAEGAVNLTSTDGKSWDLLPANAVFRETAYGHGRYAATASDGSILYSTNGLNWSVTLAARSDPWEFNSPSIAFGNGFFVAANLNGLFWSTNALDWNRTPLPSPKAVRFVRDRFFAFPSPFSATIMTSADGSVWKPIETRSIGSVVSSATDGRRLLLAGDGVISVSGETNAVVLVPPKAVPFDVEELPGRTVMFANSVAGFVSFVSTNGKSWERREIPEIPIDDEIHFVTRLDETVFALPALRTGFYSSSDGTIWQHQASPFNFRAIVKGPIGYSALATEGPLDAASPRKAVILSSADGLKWTAEIETPRPYPTLLVGGNNTLIAAGGSEWFFPDEWLYISQKGSEWSGKTIANPRENFFRELVFGRGIFAAIAGHDNKTLTSVDGVDWSLTARPGGGWISLNSIAFGANRFVVTGGLRSANGTAINVIFSARDARTWFERQGPPNFAPSTVRFASGRFYLFDGETAFQSALVPSSPYLDIVREGAGAVRLTFEGDKSSRVHIQSSSDLQTWKTEASTNATAQNSFTFPATAGRQFFKLQTE